MKLFTCILAVLLPGLVLADPEVCPNRPAIEEDLNCNAFKGHWYPLMRTGVSDETKCQEQIIQGGGDESASITFKFTFLNGTAMAFEGTIHKTETHGKLRFSIPDMLQGDESTYSVLATDYHNYAVIDMCWKFNDNEHKDYVSVMGRSTNLSDEFRTIVNAVLEKHHINPDQLLHYSHEGCETEHN